MLAVAAALALAAGSPCAAQPSAAPANLDLRAAIRFALDHDPGVLTRRATLASAESDSTRSRAAEFPAITGTLQNQVAKSNGNTSGGFGQFGLSQAQVYSQNTAQIGGSWTPYNGSLFQLQAQENKRRAEAARSDLRRAEQQLAADVAAAYWDLASRREAQRLAQSDVTYQNALVDVARAQERVGRVAGVDVLRAQVGALRSRANLTTADANAENAREALAQRIGAPPETTFAVPAVLPEPPLPTRSDDALVAQARDARPDVASARAQVNVARLADAAIESDRRPVIQLNGAFGNQTSPTSFSQAQASIDAQNAVRARSGLAPLPGVVRGVPGFWQFGATETFALGLVDYGVHHAQHRAARAQIDAALATLASTENGVAVDVRTALRNARAAAANVVTAREANRAGAESARIAQLQYRNGLISLTDATAAEQTALQAASDLVTAQVGYLTALARLHAAVGDPIEEAP